MINRTSNFVLFLAVAAALGLSLYCLYINNKVARINHQLDRMKLKYELLLAEKLSVEKSLAKTNHRLNTFAASGLSVKGKSIDSLADVLVKTNSELRQLSAQKDSFLLMISNYQKQTEDLAMEHKQLLDSVMNTNNGNKTVNVFGKD